MAEEKVIFTVENKGVKNYSIAVFEKIANRRDLTIVNGEDSILLETNVEHALVWWIVGDSKTSLTIKAKVNGVDVIVPPVVSVIAKGNSRDYGYRYFTIT